MCTHSSRLTTRAQFLELALENDHSTPHTSEDPPPSDNVDLAKSAANTTDLLPKGAPDMKASGDPVDAQGYAVGQREAQ